MAFEFTLAPEVEQWRARIAEFIHEVVIPREQDAFAHGVDDDLRRELQKAARAAEVWAPQLPKELGGGGFAFDDVAVLLEEAGTSLLGPLAMNCAAPDEGNMHLLHEVGTADQHERYLRPLAAGDVRSCFAMTEPPPGAGSDPAALRTVARRVDGGWRITGDKHLISGADGAGFAIVMARGGLGDGGSGDGGSGDGGSGDGGLKGGAGGDVGGDRTDRTEAGATMLLVDADNPGFVVGAHARTIDAASIGGHCQVRFEDCFVADDAVLGAPGEGFRYAQVRLGPARMTHCMRWLGAARRAHEIAVARAVGRELFGAALSEHGMAQALIADNEIDLAASRALLWHASWQVAHGERVTEETSRAKVFISEAVGRIVDRAVQLAGGMGTTDELVIGRIYADVRSFRIYDGASETHRMAIAKRVARRARSQ